MAAGNNDLQIRIQALIEGLNDVASLTSELEGLEQAGNMEIPDNTRAMREGADDTATSLEGVRANIGKIVAAAGGLAAIGAFLKGSAREVIDYDTRFRVLEQTIKATGGAAGITAEEVRDLSRELAKATLESVEGFENASAKLLTFKSVTGDTFREALELSQDLAQAGFGTLESNATSLGRALEDPARGMEALTRQGVTFSEAQKEVIRDLVETGEQAKAQALILEAVAGQVGGVGRAAAEGLAGSFDDLAQAFEDVRLASGKAIEPALIKLMEALNGALEFIAENMDTVIRLASVLGASLLAIGARNVLVALGSVATSMTGMATGMGAATIAARALSIAMRAIPFVGIGVAIGALLPMYLKWRNAQREAREEALRVAEAVQIERDEIEHYSRTLGDTVISMEDARSAQEQINDALERGVIVVDEVTGAYRRAGETINEMAQAHREASGYIEEVQARASQMAIAFGDNYRAARDLADQIRNVSAESVNTAGAVRGLIEGLNLANSADVSALLSAITLLGDEANELAEVVQAELITSLQQLNNEDLLAFGGNLAEALERGRISAEQFAQVNDSVLIESLQRLGLTVDEAFGRIPDRVDAAVAALDAVEQSLRAANLPAGEFEEAMRNALAAAIPQAETLEGLEILRARVQSLGEAGILTVEQIEAMNRALDESEDRLRNTAKEAAAAAREMDRFARALRDMTIEQLSRELARLGQDFRDGKISAEELRVATEMVTAEMQRQTEAAREAGRANADLAGTNRELAGSYRDVASAASDAAGAQSAAASSGSSQRRVKPGNDYSRWNDLAILERTLAERQQLPKQSTAYHAKLLKDEISQIEDRIKQLKEEKEIGDRRRSLELQELRERESSLGGSVAPSRTVQPQSTQTVRHEIRVGGQTVAIDTAPGQDRAIEQLLRAIELDLGRSQ